VDPLLDAVPYLNRITLPTRLIHGRGDRLIPFTESLRFKENIANASRSHVLVTSLFAHSADHSPASLPERVWEGAVFFKALHGLLSTV
jgi:pimeloyl-ACP methyl ester carboxylesterase